ncbi:MAG: hypothetical protein JW779_03200 [Candidatus Thorarchaeota archaeon]|nr:hypothetical protein [Candidatus Thorarchaeota archaeon]
MYLDILRENPPLKRFVSRGDIKDDIDVPNPHKNADRAIFRVVRFTMHDSTPRFQPILGGAGIGKTHLFWVMKDQEEYFAAGRFLAVYVPSPPSPVRVPLHLHACIVDEAGDRLFEQAVDMLITKFGGLKGVTHEMYDYTYALERLIVDYPGISSDVVKVLLRYRLDPSTHDLARRWLLGDALNDSELDRLGVRTILEEDDVTLATIKLLAEGSEVPLLLFVDEMEGPYNTYGEDGERHFLEVLKRIYNESKNIVIVASCLTDVWDRIYNLADGPTRSRMETPVELAKFSREDVFAFVNESMSKYWQQQNVEPPPDLLFPFSESDIDAAFQHSTGIPREAIKHLIPRLDTILFDKPIEEVAEQDDYVIKLTANVVSNSIVETLKLAGAPLGIAVQLQIGSDGDLAQKAVLVELTKTDVTKRIGIDIPNIKDWNRSGGVAAYYAEKRLKSLIDSGAIESAIIAVPADTKGAKFDALSEEIGSRQLILRMNTDSATKLVKDASEGRLPHGYSESITGLIDGLFGE